MNENSSVGFDAERFQFLFFLVFIAIDLVANISSSSPRILIKSATEVPLEEKEEEQEGHVDFSLLSPPSSPSPLIFSGYSAVSLRHLLPYWIEFEEARWCIQDQGKRLDWLLEIAFGITSSTLVSL